MAHSSGVSGAASTDIFRPLTLRLGIRFPCRCMMPLTAATHSWLVVGHPPDRCDLARENDRVPMPRQRKLESIKEKEIPDGPLCVAATHCSKSCRAVLLAAPSRDPTSANLA